MYWWQVCWLQKKYLTLQWQFCFYIFCERYNEEFTDAKFFRGLQDVDDLKGHNSLLNCNPGPDQCVYNLPLPSSCFYLLPYKLLLFELNLRTTLSFSFYKVPISKFTLILIQAIECNTIMVVVILFNIPFYSLMVRLVGTMESPGTTRTTMKQITLLIVTLISILL